jgi:predicted transcriptional regulator
MQRWCHNQPSLGVDKTQQPNTNPKDGRDMTTMSLRLDDDQARALSALAMAEETSVSEVIRDAIADRIEKRRADKDFQARLKRAVERNQEALDLLAK